MCVCVCLWAGGGFDLVYVKGPILSISIITAHKEEEIESSRGGWRGWGGRVGFRRRRWGAEGLEYQI